MTFHLRTEGLAVAALTALPDPITKSLRTRCRTLRAMAHSSGLAATYAFISSKAEKVGSREAQDYAQIRESIDRRLLELNLLPQDANTPRQTMTGITEMDSGTYLRASDDIERLLAWMARLAEAYVSSGLPSLADDEVTDAG